LIAVESTLNNEDEEIPDRRSNIVELPGTTSVDQPWPSVSERRVVSPVFTRPRRTQTPTSDEGTL